MQEKQQLTHIQGLRGIAILFIVLFHLLPSVCPNGYMGVDVFFVISGYFLIGRQLLTAETFHPLPFLKRKGERLLPPYLILLLLVAVIMIFLFPASEICKYSGLLKASLTGQPNTFLSHLSGNYFSSDSRSYPLMHLWYMGVLLQCYLLFTLLFWGWSYFHCCRRTRIICALCLGLISLAVAFLYLWHIPYDYAIDTYYWTSARIWEFILGGILYIAPKPQTRSSSFILAFGALMALAVCTFIPLPNSATGILIGAVCGSILLHYGAAWKQFSILNSSFLIWIGSISFSLYLIHWPCICFSEYLLMDALSPVTSIAIFILIILPLSLLFRKWVEAPLYPFVLIPCLWVVSATLYKTLSITQGFKEQIHRDINQELEILLGSTTPEITDINETSPLLKGAEGIRSNQDSPHLQPEALLKELGKKDAPISFVVLGDSHGTDFSAAMHALGIKEGWHGVHLNAYVTPFWNAAFKTSPHIAPGQYFDKDKASRIIHWLHNHPELKTVFIAQLWRNRIKSHHTWDGVFINDDLVHARAEELRELCKQLKSIGKQVILVTDVPRISTESPLRKIAAYRMWHTSNNYPKDLICDRNEYFKTDAAFNYEMDKMEKDGICQVLHREDAFFTANTFCAYNKEILTHRDSHHLTQAGALYSISSCIERIRSILNTK